MTDGAHWYTMEQAQRLAPAPWMFTYRDVERHHVEIFEQVVAMGYGWADW